MNFDKEKMVYRKKASAIILNAENKILLVQLHEYDNMQWNVPGGGIENDETPLEAIQRELEEELGTNKFELIEQSLITDRYDFPDELIQRILLEGKNLRGQEQVQFIFRFTGTDSDIKIQEEEVRRYKWVPYQDLKTHLLFPNQWENIVSVVKNSKITSTFPDDSESRKL